MSKACVHVWLVPEDPAGPWVPAVTTVTWSLNDYRRRALLDHDLVTQTVIALLRVTMPCRSRVAVVELSSRS